MNAGNFPSVTFLSSKDGLLLGLGWGPTAVVPRVGETVFWGPGLDREFVVTRVAWKGPSAVWVYVKEP